MRPRFYRCSPHHKNSSRPFDLLYLGRIYVEPIGFHGGCRVCGQGIAFSLASSHRSQVAASSWSEHEGFQKRFATQVNVRLASCELMWRMELLLAWAGVTYGPTSHVVWRMELLLAWTGVTYRRDSRMICCDVRNCFSLVPDSGLAASLVDRLSRAVRV